MSSMKVRNLDHLNHNSVLNSGIAPGTYQSHNKSLLNVVNSLHLLLLTIIKYVEYYKLCLVLNHIHNNPTEEVFLIIMLSVL